VHGIAGDGGRGIASQSGRAEAVHSAGPIWTCQTHPWPRSVKCTSSPSCECATTNPPATTSNAAPPKAGPNERSSAASSATSHARSTTTSRAPAEHICKSSRSPLDEHRSIERFQQTLKRHLATLEPADTNDTLQHQLDTFIDLYNTTRPHRSLDRVTPAVAYQRLPKAQPGPATPDNRQRLRRDRVDTSGVVTLRYNGRLHHIGIGRTHARTPILLLVNDRDIRVINATTGEVLRALTPDPTRDYQPIGTPRTKKPGP